jgi:hypothetical protein
MGKSKNDGVTSMFSFSNTWAYNKVRNCLQSLLLSKCQQLVPLRRGTFGWLAPAGAVSVGAVQVEHPSRPKARKRLVSTLEPMRWSDDILVSRPFAFAFNLLAPLRLVDGEGLGRRRRGRLGLRAVGPRQRRRRRLQRVFVLRHAGMGRGVQVESSLSIIVVA